MITVADVRDYIKTFGIADHYYTGKLDNKRNRSFGFYSLKRSEPALRMVGAEPSFEVIGISILIHWNNNSAETESAARRLYSALYSARDVEINGHDVYLIELLVPEPVDVGTDDKGVYERVIEMKIYYERKQ